MSGQKFTWEELARREYHAARVGGKPWVGFVADAERITGLPWDVIRVELDAIHKRDGLPPISVARSMGARIEKGRRRHRLDGCA